MSTSNTNLQSWDRIKAYLLSKEPRFQELEPNGSITFQLPDDDWLLELTPEGLLICQAGYALEDMKSILSDGTPEDLGTDELAKQAKFYLQQAVSKYRGRLLAAGFKERNEMNEDYVAVIFQQAVDFKDLSELEESIDRCKRQFSSVSS